MDVKNVYCDTDLNLDLNDRDFERFWLDNFDQ